MQGTLTISLCCYRIILFFLLKCSPSAHLQILAYTTSANLSAASGATEKTVYEGIDASCSAHHFGIAFPNLSVGSCFSYAKCLKGPACYVSNENCEP